MSRSELHNWECAIEALCGDNADKMLAIAQDIYNTAFVHGKNCMLSITPQRPKGKWILIHPLQKEDDGAYICSNCEHGDWDCDTSYKYCPFCGADMRESGDKE